MKCNPPAVSQLIAPLPELEFLDCRSASCPSGTSALALYQRATAESPRALTAAFAVRDRVSRWFGVQPIGGFDHPLAGSAPSIGDHLHFFKIEGISEQQLVLTARDIHLETMLSVDVEPLNASQSSCYITSSVVTRNAFGKAYMVPVSLAHGPIVERLLRNLSDL